MSWFRQERRPEASDSAWQNRGSVEFGPLRSLLYVSPGLIWWIDGRQGGLGHSLPAKPLHGTPKTHDFCLQVLSSIDLRYLPPIREHHEHPSNGRKVTFIVKYCQITVTICDETILTRTSSFPILCLLCSNIARGHDQVAIEKLISMTGTPINYSCMK